MSGLHIPLVVNEHQKQIQSNSAQKPHQNNQQQLLRKNHSTAHLFHRKASATLANNFSSQTALGAAAGGGTQLPLFKNYFTSNKNLQFKDVAALKEHYFKRKGTDTSSLSTTMKH